MFSTVEQLEINEESLKYRIFREAVDFLTDSSKVLESLAMDILNNIDEYDEGVK